MKYLKLFESFGTKHPREKAEEFLDDTFLGILDDFEFRSTRKTSNDPIPEKFYYFIKGYVDRSVSLYIFIKRDQVCDIYQSLKDLFLKKVRPKYKESELDVDRNEDYVYYRITIRF